MEKKVQQYYRLKQKQKEIEKELAELRQDILSYCSEQGLPRLKSEATK